MTSKQPRTIAQLEAEMQGKHTRPALLVLNSRFGGNIRFCVLGAKEVVCDSEHPERLYLPAVKYAEGERFSSAIVHQGNMPLLTAVEQEVLYPHFGIYIGEQVIATYLKSFPKGDNTLAEFRRELFMKQMVSDPSYVLEPVSPE